MQELFGMITRRTAAVLALPARERASHRAGSLPGSARWRKPAAIAGILCALLTGVQAAEAREAARVHRIGWLGSGGAEGISSALEAFRLGMRRLGYLEGRSYVVEQRWWNGRDEDMPGVIASLLAAKPDVIVAQGPTVNHGARNITRVPVVFNIASDPVSAGLARSLARPGGNLTGRTLMSLEINPKRLELLREALPRVSRLAVVYNTTHPGADKEMAANEAAARRLGFELIRFHVQTVADLETALSALRAARSEAILVLPDGFLMQKRLRIIEVATRYRLPVISAWSAYARSGALMTYGPNLDDSYGALAAYVDKILRGARPADLPIEQPTTFGLAVNLRTARALGITIPRSILLRADEVIE